MNYPLMWQLLRDLRQPVPDIPQVEQLRQAIVNKDVQATAQAVRQCLTGQVLPEGFLRRLLQQHGLGEVPVQPSPVAITPNKPIPPCQGCGGAKYNPADFNRPGGADDLLRQLG